MMADWVILSLLCALSWSAADVLSKKALERRPLPAVFWARWGYALPLLGAAALRAPVPDLGRPFWTVLFLSSPLEIAAGLLLLQALRMSPLSLTVPLLAWTPVFTALFSWIALDEVPSRSGGAGVALVAAGSYVLASGEEGGLLAPLRALRREKGCLLMLAVALIYSVTSALGKIGVAASSPAFFAFAYSAFVAAASLPLLAALRGKSTVRLLAPDGWVLAVGVAAGLMVALHFSAIGLTHVAYMISVKRTSLLFSVLLGGMVFRERQTARRLAGAAVMLVGVALVSLLT